MKVSEDSSQYIVKYKFDVNFLIKTCTGTITITSVKIYNIQALFWLMFMKMVAFL